MRTPTRTTELDETSGAVEGDEEKETLVSPKPRASLDDECVICDEAAKKGTILCDPCKKRLGRPKSFCPEQVWSRSLEPTISGDSEKSENPDTAILDPDERHALLIDPFGRPHLLSTVAGRRTTPVSMGRARRCHISIAESHVSRLHAFIEYREHSGDWFVRNESRRNNTRIDRRVVESYPLPLDSGHQITVGTVGFYFRDLSDEEYSWASEAIAATRRSNTPLVANFPTQESAKAVLLAVTAESWGGNATARSRAGGTVEVRLTELEARFLKLLLDRRQAQLDRSPSERGFVPSAEILASDLPFDSSYPDKDNLKALVRRIRRRFSSHNANDVIESRQGFGYRIHPDNHP